mmetsp:Transcript_39379/g.96893  ORF Transcript_39379/g.96893 Transcript_39379/m.96893 type:complete len:252 (-) Transcript_39379:35-790(-)
MRYSTQTSAMRLMVREAYCLWGSRMTATWLPPSGREEKAHMLRHVTMAFMLNVAPCILSECLAVDVEKRLRRCRISSALSGDRCTAWVSVSLLLGSSTSLGGSSTFLRTTGLPEDPDVPGRPEESEVPGRPPEPGVPWRRAGDIGDRLPSASGESLPEPCTCTCCLADEPFIVSLADEPCIMASFSGGCMRDLPDGCGFTRLLLEPCRIPSLSGGCSSDFVPLLASEGGTLPPCSPNPPAVGGAASALSLP